MWNMTFQRVSLLVILLSFYVLLKGRQSSQNTTMLRNECTHKFLYVFGHCGVYVMFVANIDIKILGGGFSCTLVYWCHVCMYTFFGVFVPLLVS